MYVFVWREKWLKECFHIKVPYLDISQDGVRKLQKVEVETTTSEDKVIL